MHASRGIRKFHNKTKTGCKTCRQRRVKCGEEYPECTKCQRRGVDCLWDENYIPVTQSSASPQTGSTSSGAGSPSSTSGQIIPTNGLAVSDLLGVELMHYYMAHTSFSLMITNGRESGVHCLQVLGPRLALRFSPLLHALYAVTALHIHVSERDFAGTSSEKDYLAIAEAYYQQCVEHLPITSTSSHYAPGETEPIFLAYSFMALFIVASPRIPPSPSDEQVDPLVWLSLSREYQTKMWENWDPYNGKSKPTISPDYISTEILSPDILSQNQPRELLAFPALLEYIHLNGSPDSEELVDSTVFGIYEDAVTQLKQLWAASYMNDMDRLSLMMWPSAMKEAFFTLIMSRRPRALVIFAHYCALIGQPQLRNTWLLLNRGKRDTQAILEMIGEEWLPWMQVPINQLKAVPDVEPTFAGFYRNRIAASS